MSHECTFAELAALKWIKQALNECIAILVNKLGYMNKRTAGVWFETGLRV